MTTGMNRPGAEPTANIGIDMSGGAPAFGKFERKIAARYLGAKKKDGGVGLIAVLSFACIFLAIWAMITIMSIMNGFRGEMVRLTIGLDGHMYVESAAANPTQLQVIGLRDKIKSIDEVENAFLFTKTTSFVQTAQTNSGAVITGISRDDLEGLKIVSDNFVAGDMSGFGEGLNGGEKIIVGVYLANMLGVTAGDRITVYSPKVRVTPFGPRPKFKSYEIAGVFSSGMVQADLASIYMPIIQAGLLFNEGRSPTKIQLRLKDADLIHGMHRKIRDVAGEPVFIETWEDLNKDVATALKTEQVVMRIIFMIVVLIAVFPILAAMIMLVKNKSKDIAILKTVGASSGSVLRIFLMSGAAIGVLGTIAGLVAGLLLCLNIAHVQEFIEGVVSFITRQPYKLFPPEVYGIEHIPAKVVPMEVFWVSFWGFLVATLATYFPALTASKTDPVEALRYE